MTERTSSPPDPDREIPYLLCKECGTACYVFETEKGRIREALCLACGNDSVDLFLASEWEDEES